MLEIYIQIIQNILNVLYTHLFVYYKTFNLKLVRKALYKLINYFYNLMHNQLGWYYLIVQFVFI